MVHACTLQTGTASFIYRNVPSRLNNLLEWGRRTLIGQYRTFFCHLGLKVAIALLPKVHDEYFILCSCILDISQLDLTFLLSVVQTEFEP